MLRREARSKLDARLSARRAVAAMRRFHPHPFCHDFEALLLALPDELKRYLETRADITKHYNSRRPEDQDFDRYPKKVVAFLFGKFLGRRYDPNDCRRIVEYAGPDGVQKIESCCPRFAELVGALRGLVEV